ncbi:hypothetical protein [Nocardioides nanhaiensis]|uniref:Uncharacterized protein n=1 Tax=Nocardioides nanhaiensis TaxID=1476871 RepID=A0ABP8WD08_9ACTN
MITLVATSGVGAAGTAQAHAPTERAPAASVVVEDAGDTAGDADLRGISVKATRARLVVTATFSQNESGDLLQLWIDTSNKPRNYYGAIAPESGFDALRLVGGKQTRGPRGECAGFRASYLSGATTARIAIPTRCLGSPGTVRVSTSATLRSGSGSVSDAAPNGGAWTPRVRLAR